jgi:dolichol kinase
VDTLPGERVPDLALAFSGIVILGVADSAASAIGRALGKHRILDTMKTWEGTIGGIVCCLAVWLPIWSLCAAVGASTSRGIAFSTLAVATVGSCLLEAATTQLDNIFLPLHHLAVVAACA